VPAILRCQNGLVFLFRLARVPGRKKTLTALLAAFAVLAAASGAAPAAGAAGAAAKPRTHTVAATRYGAITLGKSGAWTVTINALLGKRREMTSVGVQADGPRHHTLEYGVHGRAEPDGTIDVALAGIGRIGLRFEATSEKQDRYQRQPRCTGSTTSVIRKGIFRGTIDLHDKTGAIEFDRHSAPGQITEIPAEVCPRHKHHRRASGEFGAGLVHITNLFAGRAEDGGQLGFSATNFELAGPLAGTRPPATEFTATFSRLRHGLSTFASTTIGGTASDFVVAPATGIPSEATLTPAAPFEGSAAFKLESPQTASWTGDLRVEVPIVGTVDLAEPGFAAVLCRDAACSETAPGTDLGILGFR
jgi:hypothetical protein